MKLNKLAVAVAVSAAVGAGAAGQANATAVAQSLIDITGFILSGPGGGALTLADFAQLSFQDNLTNSANLTSSRRGLSIRHDDGVPGLDERCAGLRRNMHGARE